MGAWGRSPQWGPHGRAVRVKPLKLKKLEHLASNADGKFAKILCFAKSICKSLLVEKNGFDQRVGSDPLRQLHRNIALTRTAGILADGC